MLYNNPIAYKVDFTPPQVKELLDEHENLDAIKESSADIRRIAALRRNVGEGTFFASAARSVAVATR